LGRGPDLGQPRDIREICAQALDGLPVEVIVVLEAEMLQFLEFRDLFREFGDRELGDQGILYSEVNKLEIFQLRNRINYVPEPLVLNLLSLSETKPQRGQLLLIYQHLPNNFQLFI